MQEGGGKLAEANQDGDTAIKNQLKMTEMQQPKLI